MFDIEDTEDNIVDKVHKAIIIQNKSSGEIETEHSKDLNNEAEATKNIETNNGNNIIENKSEECGLVKPEKTFQRKPKKQQGTSIPSLSNKLYLNTGLDIEAIILPHETSIDLQTLSLASSHTEDPDFATVKKLGSGITLDKELGSINSKGAQFASHQYQK